MCTGVDHSDRVDRDEFPYLSKELIMIFEIIAIFFIKLQIIFFIYGFHSKGCSFHPKLQDYELPLKTIAGYPQLYTMYVQGKIFS